MISKWLIYKHKDLHDEMIHPQQPEMNAANIAAALAPIKPLLEVQL
jgi:hypothetical protein